MTTSQTITQSKDVADLEISALQRKNRWQFLRRMLRNPSVVVGLVILAAWLFVLLTIQFWNIPGPLHQDLVNRLKPPSITHIFGTDYLGRDVFSRVMHGGQISIPLAFIVVGISLLIGTLIGAISGYIGGMTDNLLMRFVDITLAFPAIVLAMAISSALGSGIRNAMIAMLAVDWPRYARLIRGQVLSVREYEHVVAARSIGVPHWRIILQHILPLTLSPMVVLATLDMGTVLLLAAGLSFVGLGAVPPQPEWGVMIAEGRTKFTQWWIGTFPGLAIMSMVLAFNFIGDAMRDILDPKFRTTKM